MVKARATPKPSVHQEFCLLSMRIGFGGRHHLCYQAEAAFQPQVSSQSTSLWRAQPTAGWQSQLHWGQAKCRDWNSPRTKPRLCDHCLPAPRWGKNPFHMMHSLFSGKHTPGPIFAGMATVQQQQPPNAAKDSRRNQCNYGMNARECYVMNGRKGNSCQSVKLPTQFSGFGCL